MGTNYLKPNFLINAILEGSVNIEQSGMYYYNVSEVETQIEYLKRHFGIVSGEQRFDIHINNNLVDDFAYFYSYVDEADVEFFKMKFGEPDIRIDIVDTNTDKILDSVLIYIVSDNNKRFN